MNKRVAIIGAGPCGLSQLRAFRQAERSGADIPELVCFERQADWGGLWHYTWRTGLDAHGEPVHGSMYRYLWTNGPKESLEFGDYSFEEHFGKPIPSFPPFEVLNNYILGRAEKSDIRRHVRFGTAVRRIDYDAASGRFNLRATDLDTQADYEEAFDHVVVATGHFSVPHVPSFPGIDRFPGRVLHAHDFRDALEFKGKRLLIVGGSYSAEDIALQNLKYGAASITCTYRSGAMGFKWPQGIEEVPLVTRFEGNKAHFKDGSAREVDAVILCTGYQHHFPFMADDLRLKTHNRLWPPGLYKGVIWTDNPRLVYLGMQDQYYTFSMFDAQAWYARDVMLGRIALPPREEMERDSAAWAAREEALQNPIEDIDYQTDYCKELSAATDYTIDWDVQCDNFKAWEHHKDEDITTYRDHAHVSPVTGTRAPVHHTKWWEALDDSMETFMDTR